MTTNPYAYLRKLAGYSQKEFCQKFGFAKQTIIGIESGMYPELSDRMIISLGMACHEQMIESRTELLENYGVEMLQEAYEEWCAGQRGEVADVINSCRPTEWTDEYSPMFFFVKNTVGSAQGFAKRLKVPSATLMRYTRGVQTMMPKSIESALRQIGYPYLSELKTVQANWSEGRK